MPGGLIVNADGESSLFLEFENTTDDMIYMETSDIAINGLTVYTSTWSRDAINAGARGVVLINLSSVLDEEYWRCFGHTGSRLCVTGAESERF